MTIRHGDNQINKFFIGDAEVKRAYLGDDLVFQSVTPLINFSPLVGAVAGQKPSVLVRDITNGWDLYSRNADTLTVYGASCIKMLTVLVAWDYLSADWTTGAITVTLADATVPPGFSLTTAGLLENDVLTPEHLAYGCMLPSGKDAAEALARTCGDLAYAAAGNTGDQGLLRGVQLLQAKATAIGMSNSTIGNCSGYWKNVAGDPANLLNTTTARDIATLCEVYMSNPTLAAISAAATFTANITGGRTTTLDWTNFNAFINGPYHAPAGVKDVNCDGGKTGSVFDTGGIQQTNIVHRWTAPGGQKLIVCTIGSRTGYGRYLDQRGLLYSLTKDFPYLDAPVGTDPHWANVKALVSGATGSIVDESSVGRALTINGVEVDADGYMVFDNAADTITWADASDLEPGSGDFVFEGFFYGNGTAPTTEKTFLSKNTSPSGTNRAFMATVINVGDLRLWASSSGSAWNVQVLALNMPDEEADIFFNGAPRKIAIVKSGSNVSLWWNDDKIGASGSLASIYNGIGSMGIGFGGAGTAPLGKWGDVRYTVGSARDYAGSTMINLDGRRFPRS